MTVDEFTRIFKQCPVCRAAMVFEPGNIPAFCCEGYDSCFAGCPEMDNVTKIGMVYLYDKDHYYHYYDGVMFIHLVADAANPGINPEPIGQINCDDQLMVKLFSRPKNIQKYFLVS